MLISTKDLKNLPIGATDGPIGHVRDLFFDDVDWKVRYVVADTAACLSGLRVLVPCVAVRPRQGAECMLSVSLTRRQVENNPDVGMRQALLRRNELEYIGDHGYPGQGGGTRLWADGSYPGHMTRDDLDGVEPAADHDREKAEHFLLQGDPHLHSCEGMAGHRIHAKDGDMGDVDGFLVDEQTWAIRHIVVNAGDWWPGNWALVAPECIAGVNWRRKAVSIDLSLESVKSAPRYDPSQPWSLERDAELTRHHGHEGGRRDAAPLEIGL